MELAELDQIAEALTTLGGRRENQGPYGYMISVIGGKVSSLAAAIDQAGCSAASAAELRLLSGSLGEIGEFSEMDGALAYLVGLLSERISRISDEIASAN